MVGASSLGPAPERPVLRSPADQIGDALGHELRNAVSPLVFLAEEIESLRAESTDPAEIAMRTGRLVERLRRLSIAIDRICDVALLRTDQLVLAPADADLGQIVHAVCAAAEREALAGGVHLMPRIAPGITGRWDPARVEQIASSLVSNAIRYSGGGPVDIVVTGDDRLAELVVHDRGPGIRDVDRPRIFDGLGRAAIRRHGGAGVGLWLSRSLCELMGGSIALDADVVGARFCVRLPRG